MCFCHLCNKMENGDVEIHILNIWRIYLSKKTCKIMLLILICRKWNFSTVWESLDQIVCKVLLLWRKLKHFFGKRDYCWFCGILSTSYHTTKVWYYDSRKQVILKILRVSYIQFYYHSQMLYTFFHEMWPDQENLYPTLLFIIVLHP